jgi:hypothetical protein
MVAAYTTVDENAKELVDVPDFVGAPRAQKAARSDFVAHGTLPFRRHRLPLVWSDPSHSVDGPLRGCAREAAALIGSAHAK